MLETQLATTSIAREPVHTLCTGVEVPGDIGREFARLGLGGVILAEGPKEEIGFQVAPTEHLGQLAVAGMSEEVHLPIAVLLLHKTLGKHQIVCTVGLDVLDAVDVVDDLDLAVETLHAQLPVDLGKRPLNVEPNDDREEEQRSDDEDAQRAGTLPGTTHDGASIHGLERAFCIGPSVSLGATHRIPLSLSTARRLHGRLSQLDAQR